MISPESENGVSGYFRSRVELVTRGRDIWVYGTGAAAQSFIALTGVEPKGFIESNPSSGKRFMGLKVEGPSVLSLVKETDGVVLILSMYHDEIVSLLRDHGLKSGQYHIPVDIYPSGIIVYAKNAHDHNEIVDYLNAEVRYVKLRWYEFFVRPGDDWDILVERSSLEDILRHPLLQNEPSPYAFHLKWDLPIGFVNEFLYYPISLSQEIMETREWDPRGFYRVNCCFASKTDPLSRVICI